jgi:hypothetical protein
MEDTMKVCMNDYWPKLSNNEIQTTLDWVGDTNTKRAVYTRQGIVDGIRVMRIDEYTPPYDKINDAWEYYHDPLRGIVEIADWNAGKRHAVFKENKEILWGGVMDVGDTIENDLALSIVKSKWVFPLIGTHGKNKTTYEAFLPEFTTPRGTWKDVVVIHNTQVFYNFLWFKRFGVKVYEVRRWHAPGVGCVQIDYWPNSPSDGGRQYATVSR